MNSINMLHTREVPRTVVSGESGEAHTRAWGANGATAAAPFHIDEAEPSKAGALPLGGGEVGRRKEGSYTPAGTDKLNNHHPSEDGMANAETAGLASIPTLGF
jgi:hypothetical protein